MAKEEEICLRRSFRRELKNHLRTIRFSRSIRDRKKVSAASRRLKTIAGALLRDIERKLSGKGISLPRREELDLYHRVLSQERHTKNKIYSLHEPEVLCIGKGKERKKYEFGSKVGLVMTKDGGILVGAKNFSRNVYDGDTLESLLSQVASVRGEAPESAFCDRGFRGRKQIGETHIILPSPPAPGASPSHKRKARKDFGRRSAIEPVIGHLKSEFRLARNYLKGVLGDAINVLLAAAAFNCKKWMNAALAAGLFICLFLLCQLMRPVPLKQASDGR
jgi:IS5 family transposase